MNKLIIALALACSIMPQAQARTEQTLRTGWLFTRTDDPRQASATDVDESAWQTVTVPHDWAIYGPFSWQNDKQTVAIAQDGQKEAMEHAGRTGGLPFVGTGWYRKHINVPPLAPGQRATLIFDGAMSHARVWVNGHEAGYWPYGYNSFHFDVTPLLTEGDNVIAVRLENLPESSRWYPGAGLYRNVHLRITESAHIPVWGVYITTPAVSDSEALVEAVTEVTLPQNATPSEYSLVTKLTDPTGREIASTTTPLNSLDYYNGAVRQRLSVANPQLWDVDHPNLYNAHSHVMHGTELTDSTTTPFGIRTIEVIPDKGLYVNGKKTVFKGVCNHHDLGPLGAAVNDAAIRRQIRMLKDMGCNAIRTSHNMPAPELVRAADEMGMMLMVESFDEWKKPKVKNGYNLLFDQWADKDLTNLIRHYRSNPSVVMWCIGNEVSEQWHPGDVKTARYLQDIAHREDPSRLVTQGMDGPDAVLNNNFAAIMDVAGFNYRPFKYPEAYQKLPQQIVLGTETASTVSSRGVYKFPVERRAMATYPDHQSSSYDVEHCGWSNLPEDDFIQHEDLPYCIGEFVWTGFDYLGEPTPYYTNWPSHSSLFGIIDLAGIPKDRYWLYRSHWNKQANTLYILPHWTWPGREGEVTPVFVYTNYPEAEVFINGISQGRRRKDLSIGIDSTYTDQAKKNLVRQHRYRMMWMDTKYTPGELKVVAYDADGNVAETRIVNTAGKPHHIELLADRPVYTASANDMAFIRARIVDRNGNLCPDATNSLQFNVNGPGSFHAVANGDPSSLESFQKPHMQAFHGQLTAVVSVADTPGIINVTAKSKGLKTAVLKLESR